MLWQNKKTRDISIEMSQNYYNGHGSLHRMYEGINGRGSLHRMYEGMPHGHALGENSSESSIVEWKNG
ncbi:MAG: hypothetical protein ACTSQI_07195 [Candidatus Helarchaeota archaeon]